MDDPWENFQWRDQLHPDQYKSREKVTIMSRSIIIDFVQYEIFIYIYPWVARF